MNRLNSRRAFLATAPGYAVAACCLSQSIMLAQQRTPQPRESPNAPKNQNVPGGLDTHPTDAPERGPVSTIDGPQLTAMVQRLYQMASELKEETDRSNLRDTLPVDFMRRAHEIEKLAKSIREKARG
jgi:hypothetical protein